MRKFFLSIGMVFMLIVLSMGIASSEQKPSVKDRIGVLEANYAIMKDEIAALQTQNAAQQAQIDILTADLATAQSDITKLQDALTAEILARQNADTSLADQIAASVPQSLLDLANYVNVDTTEINGLSGPHIFFEGANIHIRSGSGFTDDGGSLLGLGNLILGYNEIIGHSFRSGSHNLVVGQNNNYMSFGGLIAGEGNTIHEEAKAATVTGGRYNRAKGAYSSVGGGEQNEAVADFSCVNGGRQNFTYAEWASVNGGRFNEVTGFYATVSGGEANEAIGELSTVSGGSSKVAEENDSIVSDGTVKAWALVNLDGTLIAGENVSSVTRLGKGSYRINVDLPNLNLLRRPIMFQPFGILDEPLVNMTIGVGESDYIVAVAWKVGSNDKADAAFFAAVF